MSGNESTRVFATGRRLMSSSGQQMCSIEIAPETVVQAAYIGNHGVKLLFGTTSEMNQLPVADLALGNALLGARE